MFVLRKRKLFLMEMAEEVTPEATPEASPETVVTSETVVTPEVQPEINDSKIAELETLIATLKSENETLKNDLTTKESKVSEFEVQISELTGIKSEFESTKTKVEEYETTLNKIVETKSAKVPENFKSLMPKNANIVETLEWLNNAESTGLFGSKDVEIGKPMNPSKSREILDNADISPTNLLAMAYGSNK